MTAPRDAFISVAPIAGQAFHFRAMTGEEELNRPFAYEVEVLSKNDDLSLSGIVGKQMSVIVQQSDGGERCFNGYVTRFSELGMSGRYHAYRAVLRPWLWLLSHTSDCRIFQNKTVPEIVKAVFNKHTNALFHESFENAAEYQPRPYTVQYRETDFAFVSRLLEEAGIAYHFVHMADSHTLVLTDAPSVRTSRRGYGEVPLRPRSQVAETECLHTWNVSEEVKTAACALHDFDYRQPGADLLARRGTVPDDRSLGEHFEYPGRYASTAEAERAVQVRLDESHSGRRVVQAVGPVRGLGVGDVFTLTEAPWSNPRKRHLVVEARYELRGHDPESGGDEGEPDRFACALTLHDAAASFRPARRTPRPVIQGPQTAFVVTPRDQSSEGEEIWTDDHGRILVRFHWERARADVPPQRARPADEASCFVRVASAWAGKRWGLQFTPRVGMEVVVEFLDGDPDRPLVTGAVYNAVNRPPYPNTAKTQSGLRTHSTPGGTDQGNELRFEDKKGAEELFVFAARDQRVTVQADRHLTVGGAASVTVSGTRTTTVEKKDKLTLSDEQELTVAKRAVHTFAHGLELNVTGADQVTYVEMNRTEQVMKTLSLESPQRICLSVGASTIVMTPTEIAFAAERITINGQAGVIVSGAAIKLNA